MKSALLASILALPAAAFADVPLPVPMSSVAPVSAAAPTDVDRRSLELLRAIRAASAAKDKNLEPLRAELDVLRGGDVDAKALHRLARAADFLSLLDAGKPLPPFVPEERAGGANDPVPAVDRSAADEAARAREAAASARAQAKAGALLDGIVGAEADQAAGADASFDGAAGRPPAPVAVDPEPEPAPGYHTADADDFLAQTDDSGRLDALTAAMSDLFSKAGLPDKGGKRAAALAGTIAADIEANPSFAEMVALRVRERPDGELSIVYRVRGAGVVEEDLNLTLAPDDDGGGAVASRKKHHGHGHGHHRHKGQGAAAAAAADDDGGDGSGGGDDGGASVTRVSGRDGGAEVDAVSAGAGSGAHFNRGVRGDADEGARADRRVADTRGAASRGRDVDPDGGSMAAQRGGPSSAARSSRASLPGGFTAARGPGDEPLADREAAEPAARRVARPRTGGAQEEAEIPSLTHLRGDLAGGRGGASAAAPSMRSGAAAASARPDAPATAAGAFAAAPSAPTQAPAYDASRDGPLSDAVAGSPSDSAASPAPSRETPTAPAPARSASVPTALLLASIGLGAGVFMRRAKR